ISRNGRAVRREDRSTDRIDRTATGKCVMHERFGRVQELAEITDTHLCRRHGNGLRVARAIENRRAVPLTVEREEEERTIATVVKMFSAFAKTRQEDWSTNRAVVVVGNIIRHRRRSRIVKLGCCRTQKSTLIYLTNSAMNVIAARLESRGDDAAARTA